MIFVVHVRLWNEGLYEGIGGRGINCIIERDNDQFDWFLWQNTGIGGRHDWDWLFYYLHCKQYSNMKLQVNNIESKSWYLNIPAVTSSFLVVVYLLGITSS